MGRGTKLTKTTFDCIKILLKSGESQVKIAGYLNISATTVGRVNMAETYEEYQQIMAERTSAQRAAMAVKKYAKPEAQVIKPVPSEPINLPQRKAISGEDSYQIVRLLKEQNDILTLISNKLAFIVDELTGPIQKEGQA